MITRNRVVIALFRWRVSQRYLWPILERRGFIWFVTVDRELYVLRWDDRPDRDLVARIRHVIESDYREHRTDRGSNAPDPDTYTGQAITARAERLAAVLWAAGYRRCG